MKNPQMRMLILLAVFWVAGTLLLAAESEPTLSTKPAAATAQKAPSAKPEVAKTDATKTDATKTGDAKTDATKADATKTDAKEANKSGSAAAKPSIAEQAEAALKAAYEADPKEAAKNPDAEQHAKDDTQMPPNGSAPKGPSPQRFVPSEQVRADFDVSFPIDI